DQISSSRTCLHYSNIKSPLGSRLTVLKQTRNGSSSSSPEKAFQERVLQVKDAQANPYPRLAVDQRTLSCAEFSSRFAGLANNESVEGMVVVSGRVRTYRTAGNKLIFFDIMQDGHKIQVMCNKRQLDAVTPAEFKRLSRLLRRGDAFSVIGKPHRTGRGELTVDVTEMPKLLAPCLHDVPVHNSTHETSPYPRHVQFLADPVAANIVRARASLIQYLRQFFVDRSFMEVSTPIIGSGAGGAIARPFNTSATEFPNRELSLRIAPELWLKRLVVGGFDRVFEIGPSFRNEGLDKTHNPEFTTCEFYQAYANLEDLMRTTEDLLSGMASHIDSFNKEGILQPTKVNFTAPFRRVDFITGIQDQIGHQIPDLASPEALLKVQQLFHTLSLPLPQDATLPRLLDELCSTYLEPTCTDPTFIINPPECLSPLSKSFTHPITGQIVAARGELFIEGKEIVNTYEEENSPFEQRRKFEDQLRFSHAAGEAGEIDESYLEALEWGLPSTGGWGCGIDRLVMLFTGAKRIGDVLAFGNLRAVTRPAMITNEATVAQAVTVSLKDLENGSVSFETLTEAFGPSSLGIIVVKDLPEHFVQLRAQVLSNASNLAALSDSELESLESPESKYLVGWSCGKETLKSGQYDTLKGSYYVNCAFYQDPSLDSAPADGFPDLPQYTAPNIWPPQEKLPTFRTSVENLCSLIIQTAALVADACDRYAEANIEDYTPGYLKRVVEGSLTTKARLLHYFPSDNDEDPGKKSDDDWCATHLDHGCLTGLTSAMFLDEAATLPTRDSSDILQELSQSPDPSAGLYIHSRSGDVVKVNIPKDCLAFQTGEALQLITRGKFRAVPHFVKGAKGAKGSRIVRNTLAVFTQPNLHEEVEPGLSFAEFARATVQRTY
ncbi:Nucleic acid-binding OB-fold, partial [Penicillium taxi]|uniref:Nucleic acid-binding OB-fold n=1 Tax=Penicillium taxi TaxID=168475 RepID=UPI002544E39A